MRRTIPLRKISIAQKVFRSFIFLFLIVHSFITTNAQFTCTAGNVYGVRAFTPPSPGISDLKNLYQINATTGVPTFIVNLFGSPPANSAPIQSTAAIALDPYNNRIYYAQNAALNPAVGSSIYSYNLTTGTFTATSVLLPFAGGAGVQDNWNKAAFNPVDRKLYLHDGTSNRVAIYNPAAPVVAGVNPVLASGTLTVTGLTSPGSFNGGDIAFDGLGNLTGIFYPSSGGNSVMAVFPGVFNAGGVYQGVSTSGTQVFSFPATQTATGIAYRNDGQLLVSINSFTNPVVSLNVATQTQTALPNNQPGFPLSDLTSCVFPSPNFLTFSKAARFVCTGTQTTITYTIKVKNSGLIFSNNTMVYDTLPAGLTVTSVKLNGTAIAGATNATLRAGVRVNTPGDAQGVVNIATTDTAILVINATAPGGQATYSNKAWLTYNGIQTTGVSKQGSDNPATSAANDGTAITTTCLQVSGTVFNDANGLTDNIINGAGTNAGGLNVVLVNPLTGNVVATAPVAANGTYTLNGIPAGTFTAIITTATATVGSPPPSQTLPVNYVNTGEGISVSGDGTSNGSTSITVSTSAITGVNFGIDQRPTSNPVSTTISQPGANEMITLNGAGSNPPAPAGIDPEDGILGAGNTLIITRVPTDAELYYNGVLVTNNQVIANFDPFLLQMKLTNPGTVSVDFQYNILDAAGIASGSAASYVISWAFPLPVTINSFTLTKNEKNVLLQWSTASEQNSKVFIIERSTSGISGNWKTIGTIPSAGNSNSELHYSFSDVLPATGNNFYRLKMIDRDGTFSLSDIRSTSFTGDGLTLRAYPNPVSNVLKLMRDADVTGTTHAQLLDQNGRVLRILQLTETSTDVDMSALPKGIYQIKYFRKDGSAATLTIAKQ